MYAVIAFLFAYVHAFDGNWTWIEGLEDVDVNVSVNFPGSRFSAITWFDLNDVFYLFGGSNSSKDTDGFNDMWRFDGENWTWIGGADPLGNASYPSARKESTYSVDTYRNLWMFGGLGLDYNDTLGYLDDFWRWNGSIWIRISGTNATGFSGNNESPGSRSSALSWIDSHLNFWLFGGKSDKYLSDMWKFNGTSWILVSYGNISATYPKPRAYAARWIDPYDTLWLFGGLQNGLSRNDLWKFQDEWTLVHEPTNRNGSYGVQGVASSSNIPSHLWGASSWSDTNGNLYLFGGIGYAKDGASGQLNSLWRYDGYNWVWLFGSESAFTDPVYGEMGVESTTNDPGARSFVSISLDSHKNVWMFGGAKNVDFKLLVLSDLWKLELPFYSATTGSIASSDLKSFEKGNSGVIVGVVVASVAFVLSAGIGIVVVKWNKRNKKRVEIELAARGELVTAMLDNIEIKQKLGGGNFGEVFLAVWNFTNVAAKKLRSGSQEEWRKELTLVRVAGVCSGMAFLESVRVVHRDLSARNCLITESDGKLVAKVTDFGMSRALASEKDFYKPSSSTALPIRWSAPEVITRNEHSHASDVWSFGVVCWEIFSFGATPFQWLTNREVVEQMTQGGLRLDKPSQCSDSLWTVISSCFEENPSLRPTFQQLSSKLNELKGALIAGSSEQQDIHEEDPNYNDQDSETNYNYS